MLRAKGVVGQFVEFYGPGVTALTLSERATIANMSPEFGATCAFFPVDEETLKYLRTTGRASAQVDLVAKYCKIQGLWHNPSLSPNVFSRHLALDLSRIVPCVAGPKRPQDRVLVGALGLETEKAILAHVSSKDVIAPGHSKATAKQLSHGDVVIAAITSCTNTSNPAVLITAGLLARKASELGLSIQPWVKASFAPGSKVVVAYLQSLGLLQELEKLGFFVVGYGCTTCIGNSGPLDEAISQGIRDHGLCVSAVLSGNRNFEGRIHPEVALNWLASPPLVVAYALAGTTKINVERDPLGYDKTGRKVFLKDLWPDIAQVETMQAQIAASEFTQAYANIFQGNEQWESLDVSPTPTYAWQAGSTYIQRPDFFDRPQAQSKIGEIKQARILALLGDSITTDHISPAGFIPANSPAGRYLVHKQVHQRDFNSYGARRGNHHVMVRGTFANIRLKNLCVDHLVGGYTVYWPTEEVLSIYDAAQRYQADKTPLVVFAGKEYGTGSSRDWAAKGTMMLGVRAVIAESFERIHRSNLVGMGVLPCELIDCTTASLALKGNESIDIQGIENLSKDNSLTLIIHRGDGRVEQLPLRARLDTLQEHRYFQSQGVLPYVLHEMMQSA